MKKTEAYKDLVRRVRAINPKAASYLNGKKILVDCPLAIGTMLDPGLSKYARVDMVVNWNTAPQGRAFWKDISLKLGETYENGLKVF